MSCEDRKHRESSLGRLLEAGGQGEDWKMGRNWLLYVGWGGVGSVVGIAVWKLQMQGTE